MRREEHPEEAHWEYEGRAALTVTCAKQTSSENLTRRAEALRVQVVASLTPRTGCRRCCRLEPGAINTSSLRLGSTSSYRTL